MTELSSPEATLISVVYDGPPFAGKTTTVRALARGLGREVYTPAEQEGRTVYYDWLEYTGGRFEGAPIRCQIVTVPGQARWARRREHLLDRADVVVFVGDTTRAGWPETVTRLAELRARLDGRTGLPVGLVFQANKRDRDDAIALAEINAQAASARTAVVETTAHDGSGVREAFLFAVRLALDRVRAERRTDGLDRAGLADDADGLLESLRVLESGPVAMATAAPISTPAPTPVSDGPPLPTPDAPTGFVWPPVEGRILLREAAPEGRAQLTTAGDCIAGLGGAWRLHASAAAVFADLDEARAALVAWARYHVACAGLLSDRRCLCLTDAGAGGWRLWQVVHREPTLRDLEVEDLDAVLAEARRALAGAALPCTVDTIGLTDDARPLYVGLMPPAFTLSDQEVS